MSNKETYEFTTEGFYDGNFYRAGDRIELYPAQAKYESHRMRKVSAPPTRSAKSKSASKE